MNANCPKISVVTVSFNQGEFIQQNIESVLQQDYPNFEHIVIDGGSTDNTLEILRSYPHVNWTSEPDRGQSHALNKGFAKAGGEIIAWLNSDDWYAPGAFRAVAEALQDYPIVLTAADEVDRDGKWRQTVPNTERNFFDLLRYWIPYAWLAQTGVFFRRSLLEEVKLPNGSYVDEELYYTMDIELWHRMALKYPFSRRLDKVCAYFRMYEENKTGKSPLSAQKECGRIFRRYISALSGAERRLSYLIPVQSLGPQLARTVDSLMNQSLHDFDILFIDLTADKAQGQALRETVQRVENAVNVIGIRYFKPQEKELLPALNLSLQAALSPLISLIWPGDVLNRDFTIAAINVFSVDPAGLAFALKARPKLQQALHNPQTYKLHFEELLKPVWLPFNFVARKAALTELGGFDIESHPQISFRQAVLRLLWKGWHISALNDLDLSPDCTNESEETSFLERNNNYINSKLVCALADEFAGEPFGQVRSRHGWMPVLNPAVVEEARLSLPQHDQLLCSGRGAKRK